MRSHALLFASSFLLACSSDGSVAPPNSGDSSTAVDGGDPSDAPSFETLPPVDAGCTSTWCTCFAPKAVFCDDFDKPNETVGQGWSEGVIYDNNTVVDLGTIASSNPNALHASVSSNMTTRLESGITTAAGALAKPLTVAFDLRIASGGANCVTASAEFARVSLDTPFNRTPQSFVAFGVLNGGAKLYLSSLGIVAGANPTNVPMDTWVRVRLRVSIVNGELRGDVVYGQPGLADDTQAIQAGVASYKYNGTSTISYVSMGVFDFAAKSTGACEARIDNVAFYQQ